MKLFWQTIMREGEGAGAGGGDGGNAGGGAGGQGGGGGTPPDFIPQGLQLPAEVIGADAPATIQNIYGRWQEASKPPYDPDKLPDEYKGKQPPEVFDMMSKRIDGLRAELGKRGEVPKEPAGYEYAPSETAQKFLVKRPEGEPDPVLEIAKQVAHANNMPVAAFNGFVNGMYEKMAEAGIVQAPIDPKAEIAAFGKAEGLADEVAAGRRVDELTSWAKKFAEQAQLPPEAAVELEILTDTANGLRALSAIQKSLMERGLDLGGQPAAGKAMSDEEFERLSGSTEIEPGHKNYSADKRKAWEIESNRRADLKARQRQAG